MGNTLESPTTQETSPTETFMGMDESMFSTLTESRVQGDLSTTGGLGDNEGMDTTMGHADPEEMDTSSEPKTQRKKRRIEAKQADTTDEDANKGKRREDVKPVEATVENPTNETPTNETHLNENPTETDSMAQEIENLKVQHRLQLEECQQNSERTLENIKKSMEEKMEKERTEMASEIQEMRRTMEQSMTS